MNKQLVRRLCAACVLSVLSCGTALASKPDGDNKGQGKKPKHHQQAGERVANGQYFAEHQRAAVHDYYGKRYKKTAKCPPGLAKKGNGCMPPGQARKWALGQPLGGSVVLYPVPPAVVTVIGPPPAGHRYVRIANDLLLITIGTQMVVDAIEDLMAL